MSEQAAKTKGVVDIVFLIDVTGSMQPCIDALKNNIAAFIDTLTTKGPNNDNPVKHWRAKAVGYRDAKEDTEWFADAPFVDQDPAALKAQLSVLKAAGGGDEPESLLDALHRVATMPSTAKAAQAEASKWRYKSEAARVVVAFTDASYHPTMEQPKGGTVSDVINALHANRIILNLFAPEMACHDELSKADKSDYMAIPLNGKSADEALEEFTRDQANFRRTLEALAKSVSKSADTPAL